MPGQDTATEIKTCEMCGRLFVRVRNPGQQWNRQTRRYDLIKKQRDCDGCLKNPPKEEDLPKYERVYRLASTVKL